MLTDLVQIRRMGEKKIAENQRFRVHLKRHNFAERRLKKIAQDIEDAIDCKQCANCCRVATAVVTERDVEKLAKFLGMKPRQALLDYTEESEEEGYILKHKEGGCVFLEGNLCSVYEARPASCSGFPHLIHGAGSFLSRMWKMPDRACYCPIVYNSLEEFKREVGFHAGN
ncbi:MAG TPA: YkgJ family cysteine cluster protein [Bryobacteraceae bacterium]|jgi:Fe-S-cluster containining protein|nr:YkgJ family cysteine cluster protein [Bryobacteraceae bacterium]